MSVQSVRKRNRDLDDCFKWRGSLSNARLPPQAGCATTSTGTLDSDHLSPYNSPITTTEIHIMTTALTADLDMDFIIANIESDLDDMDEDARELLLAGLDEAIAAALAD